MSAAISVTELGKRYRLGARGKSGQSFAELLMSGLTAPWRRWRQLRETADGEGGFWALRDVSFEVAPGEVVGIIGQNGAGKSTLLKILSRITTPTTGRVELRGKVRSLLEVGTGFHPELTGRENIYLNGAILGMSRREIAGQFERIVDYAGIERFLDTPVKRYSSGMYVRLAFAVAAHLQPEILIVDEVLAVGDAAFQRKCLGTMRDVASQGRTVLFVSHNMAAVAQLCQRAILLKYGEIVQDGAPSDVIRQYLGQGSTPVSEALFDDENASAWITRLALRNEHGQPATALTLQRGGTIELEYTVRDWPLGAYVAVLITDQAGIEMLWSCDVESVEQLGEARRAGEYKANVTIPANTLTVGDYSISAGIYNPSHQETFDYRQHVVRFEVCDGESLIAHLGMRYPAIVATPMTWHTQKTRMKITPPQEVTHAV